MVQLALTASVRGLADVPQPESTNKPAAVTWPYTPVAAVLPVLVRVKLRVPVLPTVTMPKSVLVFVCRLASACTPAPERSIDSGLLTAVDVTVSFAPTSAVPLVGAYLTVMLQELLTGRLPGVALLPQVLAVMDSPFPVTEACTLATAVLPVLVKVNTRVVFEPTTTDPKSVEVFALSAPWARSPVPLSGTVSGEA